MIGCDESGHFLDPGPYRWDLCAGRELYRLLVRAFSNLDEAKFLVRQLDAGLFVEVDWQGSAATVWRSILDATARRWLLRELVERALELEDAAAYHTALRELLGQDPPYERALRPLEPEPARVLGLRVRSTPESFRRRDVTWLAVLETALAMGTAVALAACLDSMHALVFGGCTAPFLLLRSPEAVRLSRRLFRKADAMHQSEKLLVQMAYYSLMIIVSLAIRVIATLRFAHHGVRHIPGNWLRVAFALDVTRRPELVPGVPLRHTQLVEGAREAGFWRASLTVVGVVMALLLGGSQIFSGEQDLVEFAGGLLVVLCTVFMFGTAGLALVLPYFYRFGLKATALFWIPLVYMTKETFDPVLPTQERVREMRERSAARLVRGLSWGILLLFALKVFALDWVWTADRLQQLLGDGAGARQLYDDLQGTGINQFALRLFAPAKVHLWHLLCALNATLTLLFFYLYVDKAPYRLRARVWTLGAVGRLMAFYTAARYLISSYTIAVVIACAVTSSQLGRRWEAHLARLNPQVTLPWGPPSSRVRGD